MMRRKELMQFDAAFMKDEARLLLKEMPVIKVVKLVCFAVYVQLVDLSAAYRWVLETCKMF